MAQLISQSHALCIQTFQQLCKAAADSEQCPESFQLALLDELDKYRIWCGNLGASHAGRTYKLSLDYRLREATFYKDQVISIVDTLQRHVEDARQIVCGERKPFEDFSESDSDEESPSLSPSNDTPYSKGHDSPWGSSSESGSIPESEPSKVGPEVSGETSGLPPPATELAQLLEAIKLTIRSLYKLPIRKPAPVDRLNGNLTDAISCYQPFDCMYVRDKFPRLSREVADRIGSHITRRRQLLLYRRERQEYLRPKEFPNDPGPASASTGFQIETKQHLLKNGDEASSAQLHHATASQPESKPQTLRSKATTFIHDGEQPFQLEFFSAPSVGESISQTSIAASQATQEAPVEVPERPKNEKGMSKTMFECNFCALTTHAASDRVWKKHVLSDLQPYVCTFPECNLGDYMFANRDAWFQHEMQTHRVEYFCNVETHPVYRRLSDFKDHMQREHVISLADLANPAAMNMFRRPAISNNSICNLCFREQPVKNMKSHVSKHLEQVSLFAIPRADYDEGDIDAGDDQSCQAQHNLENLISQDDKQESLFMDSEVGFHQNNFDADRGGLEESLCELQSGSNSGSEPDTSGTTAIFNDFHRPIIVKRSDDHFSGKQKRTKHRELPESSPRTPEEALGEDHSESISIPNASQLRREPKGEIEQIRAYPETSPESKDGYQIHNAPYRHDLMGTLLSRWIGTYLIVPRLKNLESPILLGAIIANPLYPDKPLSLPASPPDRRTYVNHEDVTIYPENISMYDDVSSQLVEIIRDYIGDQSARGLTTQIELKSLETVSLREEPTDEEVFARVNNEPRIQEALGGGVRRRPIYMITGLKTTKRLRFFRQDFQEGAQVWLDSGTDIILGYRLHVIAKKGLRGKLTVDLYRLKPTIL